MTRPRVLAHVEDPGAANGFMTLGAELDACGVELMLFAEATAAVLLTDHAIPYQPRAGHEAARLVDMVAPSLVLVGTSENPQSIAHALVHEARRRCIPSVAFVDAAANAPHRFRGATAEPLAYAPERLLVPDRVTSQAYVALGFPDERIAICGHPVHDTVLAAREELRRQGRERLREEHFAGAGTNPVLLFCTELSSGLDGAQFQRSPAYTLGGRGGRHGRTEIVLEEVLDATRATCPEALVALRLHPKQTAEELGALVDEADALSKGGSPLPVLFASDLVVGMSSTILVEASLLGVPTLSVLPRAEERAWLPTIGAGATPCVTTRTELLAALHAWRGGQFEHSPFDGVPGASRRMAQCIVAQLPR